MFNGLPTRSVDAPQLWMELFDHDTKMSIDGSSCHEIDDAVSVFEALVALTKTSGELSGPEANDAQA